MAQESISQIRDPNDRIKALWKYAGNISVDNNVPPRRYFRSGKELLRMAKVYYSEGDLESAFILYYKYVTLFVEKLPKHEKYRTLTQSELRDKPNSKQIKDVFSTAEQLKSKLKEKYAREEAIRAKLEEQEQKRLAKQAEEQRKIREEEELSRKLNEFARISALQDQFKSEDSSKQPAATPSAKKIENLLEDHNIYDQAANQQDILTGPSGNSVHPPLVPDRSLKHNVTDNLSFSSHFTSVGAKSSNPYGLRDVIVPGDIVSQFITIATANTARNIETCGILAGCLSKEKFIISHLLIPQQSGTSDSCSTENEEQLFDYQDTHDLITLGWIHTHPSQTAFLSSVDLHTHLSYQIMLPEAIAIVYSPKFNETGTFNLTPNYGLSFITNCTKQGFHPHPSEPPLFETCKHVHYQSDSRIIIADLRR